MVNLSDANVIVLFWSLGIALYFVAHN